MRVKYPCVVLKLMGRNIYSFMIKYDVSCKFSVDVPLYPADALFYALFAESFHHELLLLSK